MLGVATGLLWAPCAGPILGIIFTAAAIQGATLSTTLLLLAYALGAATSLALALLVGGKVFARMKKSLGASERIRQVLGVLVLVGVAAIALGLDTRVLSKLSSAQTASLESSLARKLGVGGIAAESRTAIGKDGMLMLPVEGELPPLDGLGPWINSAPLTREQLARQGRGDRLLDLQLHQLPALDPLCPRVARALCQGRAGVIGVHAPEFAFERNPDNVRKAVTDLGIRYPVALDNEYKLWRALKNHYWPAHYFVDAQGRVRYHHFGEGEYARVRAGHPPVARRSRAGAERRRNGSGAIDPGRRSRGRRGERSNRRETYIGYARADRFVSPGGLDPDRPEPLCRAALQLNNWSLEGDWIGRPSKARGRRHPERRSTTASTPATCIWCSARPADGRCGSR